MTCPYQTAQRVSDFTLGDIWETGNTKLDDNKGTTLVHVWTKKGEELLDSIKENVRLVSYPIEKSRGAERSNTMKIQPNRNQLFEDANNMAVYAFFAKYAPYAMKIRMKNASRYLLWRIGLQNLVRHVKHLIIHR